MEKRIFRFRSWNSYLKVMTNNIHKLDSLNEYLSSESQIIMQYVGFKDKNGKDIYEGDILKAHGIVSWNDIEHRWSAIDLNWNNRREWHDIDYLTSEFEIIGNIYENPEMLS